jgi:hypothetical protein
VRDFELTRGTLSRPWGRRIQSRVAVSRYQRNLNRREDLGSAPREELQQIGMSIELPARFRGSVDLDRFHLQDRLVPGDLGVWERGQRWSLGRSWKGWNVFWETRVATRENRMTPQTEKTSSQRYAVSCHPSRRLSLSVYGGQTRSRVIRETYLLREYDNLGASFRWQPRPGLVCTYRYQGFRKHSSQPDETIGDMDIEYTRAGGDCWSFRAFNQVSWAAKQGPTYYEMSWSTPLDVPIGRRTRVGILAGRVVDQDKPGQPGLPGVIVRVADAGVITGSSGDFAFGELAPGTYTLGIDGHSIGLDRIPAAPEMLQAVVLGGKTTRLTVGVVRGAVIRGVIEPVTASAPAAPSASKGGDEALAPVSAPVGGIRVELSQGKETLRQVTNERGEFVFTGLFPGPCRFRVEEADLPPYHSVRPMTGEWSLQSGEEKQVTFSLIPISRQIILMETGDMPVEILPDRVP